MVVAREKGGGVEREMGKGWVGGSRWNIERDILLPWVHEAACRWCFLESYTTDLYAFVSQVTPINSIKI